MLRRDRSSLQLGRRTLELVSRASGRLRDSIRGSTGISISGKFGRYTPSFTKKKIRGHTNSIVLLEAPPIDRPIYQVEEEIHPHAKLRSRTRAALRRTFGSRSESSRSNSSRLSRLRLSALQSQSNSSSHLHSSSRASKLRSSALAAAAVCKLKRHSLSRSLDSQNSCGSSLSESSFRFGSYEHAVI